MLTLNDIDRESETSSVPPLILNDDENSQEAGTATMYKYRDFGNVTEDQLSEETGPDGSPCPSPPPPSRTAKSWEGSSIRVQKFPVKLYAILGKKEFEGIITWMPHGRSWKVLKPNLFESMVMPLFFEYSNYHSFNRLINAWSFRRISSGPDRGSYYHELFLRGMPHLQKYMRRLPKTHKKLPMNKDDEPDFYKLDKKNPLPALQDAPSMDPASSSPSPMATPRQAMHGNMPLSAGMGPRGGAGMMSPMMQKAGNCIPTSFHNMANRNRMAMNEDHFMSGGMGMSGMGGMGMGGMGPAMMGMPGAARAGINQLREQPGLMGGHDPLLGNPSAFSPAAGYHQSSPDVEDQYQRLRHIQQMKLMESRPTANPMMFGGNDPYASMMQADAMSFRLGRQQC